MQNYGNFPFGVLVLPLPYREAFIFPLLLARNGSQLCVFTFPLLLSSSDVSFVVGRYKVTIL